MNVQLLKDEHELMPIPKRLQSREKIVVLGRNVSAAEDAVHLYQPGQRLQAQCSELGDDVGRGLGAGVTRQVIRIDERQ